MGVALGWCLSEEGVAAEEEGVISCVAEMAVATRVWKVWSVTRGTYYICFWFCL